MGKRCFTLEEIDKTLESIDERENVLSMIGDSESNRMIKNNDNIRLKLKELRVKLVNSGESEICVCD